MIEIGMCRIADFGRGGSDPMAGAVGGAIELANQVGGLIEAGDRRGGSAITDTRL